MWHQAELTPTFFFSRRETSTIRLVAVVAAVVVMVVAMSAVVVVVSETVTGNGSIVDWVAGRRRFQYHVGRPVGRNCGPCWLRIVRHALLSQLRDWASQLQSRFGMSPGSETGQLPVIAFSSPVQLTQTFVMSVLPSLTSISKGNFMHDRKLIGCQPI